MDGMCRMTFHSVTAGFSSIGESMHPCFSVKAPCNKAMYTFFTFREANCSDRLIAARRVFARTRQPDVGASSLCTKEGRLSAPMVDLFGCFKTWGATLCPRCFVRTRRKCRIIQTTHSSLTYLRTELLLYPPLECE